MGADTHKNPCERFLDPRGYIYTPTQRKNDLGGHMEKKKREKEVGFAPDPREEERKSFVEPSPEDGEMVRYFSLWAHEPILLPR